MKSKLFKLRKFILIMMVLAVVISTTLCVSLTFMNKAEAETNPAGQPISDEWDLPRESGDYYLAQNIWSLSRDWQIPPDVIINLDLNGKTFSPGDFLESGGFAAHIVVSSESTLSISNSDPDNGGIKYSCNSSSENVYYGGCFYVDTYGTLNIKDTYIYDNRIYLDDTTSLKETNFYGGVVYSEGNVNFTNVVAEKNRVSYVFNDEPYNISLISQQKYYGGVIYSRGGKVSCYQSKFLDNYAYSGGVIYATDNAILEINNCEFKGNLAGLYDYYSEGIEWDKIPYGSCVCCMNNTKLNVINSYFHENGANQELLHGRQSLPWIPVNWNMYSYTGPGGAIAAINSEVKFETNSEDNYTRIVDNFGFYGGGLYSSGSTINIDAQGELIDYVLFEQNSALYGGAMYLQDGEATLNGGKFSNNGAIVLPEGYDIPYPKVILGGFGGAIEATSYGSGITASILEIYNCQIMDNYASYEGGGLYIDQGTNVNIYDGTFRNNSVTSPSFKPTGNCEGGAIKNEGELYIYGGDFRFNKAHNPMWRNAYGGCICNSGRLTLKKQDGSVKYPVITGNSSDNAAGIANIDTRLQQYPELNLYDCDLSYNTAEFYCGILNGPGAAFKMFGGYIGNNAATNCAGVGNYGTFIMFGGVISENQAVSFGGGIYSYGQISDDWFKHDYLDPNDYLANLYLSGGKIENNYGEGVLVDYKSRIVFNNPITSNDSVKIEGNHTDSATYSNYQNATNLVINANEIANVFVELEQGFNPSSVTGFSFVDIPIENVSDNNILNVILGIQKGYSQVASGRLTNGYKTSVGSELSLYDCFFYEGSSGTQVGGTSSEPTKTDTDEIWVIEHDHEFEYVAGTSATGDTNTIYYYCLDSGNDGCYFHAHKDIKLVLSAESVVFDGNVHEASYEENISHYTDVIIPAIEYYNMADPSTKLSGAPKDAGSYEARLKLGEATAVAPFSIFKYIEKAMASADSYAFQFDGTPKTPVITVKDGDTDVTNKMVISGDTTGTNIGKYVITIKPKTNNEYLGDTYLVWAITESGDPLVLKPEMLSVDATSYVYDGSEKTPSITVKDGTTDITDQVFISGDLSATEIGAYSIVVAGCEFDEEGHRTDSAYAGILSKGWMITGDADKKLITEDMISISPDTFDYDGSVKTPTVAVKDGNVDLIEGGFVTLSGETSSSEPGTHAIVVTANASENASAYYGSAVGVWKINSSVTPIPIPTPTPGGGGASAFDVLTSAPQTDDPLPIVLVSIFIGISLGIFLTVRKLLK